MPLDATALQRSRAARAHRRTAQTRGQAALRRESGSSPCCAALGLMKIARSNCSSRSSGTLDMGPVGCASKISSAGNTNRPAASRARSARQRRRLMRRPGHHARVRPASGLMSCGSSTARESRRAPMRSAAAASSLPIASASRMSPVDSFLSAPARCHRHWTRSRAAPGTPPAASAKRAQRHLAAAAERAAHRPFGAHAGSGFGVIERRQHGHHIGAPGRGIRCRARPARRRAGSASAESSARDALAQAEALQPGGGEDDRGVLAFVELAQAGAARCRAAASIVRCGKRARSWHSRRRLEVPTTLPGGSSSRRS